VDPARSRRPGTGCPPDDEPLELPGFGLDRDDKVSTRDVEPGEAVAVAQSALDALGVRAGDPLFIHLGT
jgi:hypothetical protein